MTFPATGAAETQTSPLLVRGLGLLDATMIVTGSMIGSGIFIVSAESARLVGSPGWLLAAWALAGLLTITGALCCAELAGMWPQAGGQYVFLREAYGSLTGFLFGWALFLVIQTGTIAAVAIAFANFTGVFFNGVSAANYLIAPMPLIGRYAISLSTQQLLAIVMIALLTFLNTRGLRLGKLIQNVFTLTKTAALIGLIAVGICYCAYGSGSGDAAWWTTRDWWQASSATIGDDFDLPAMLGGTAILLITGRAMTGPLFAQSAWNNVTFAGGEIKHPGVNLPRALVIGCSLVVALYLLANVSYLLILPFSAVQNAPQNRVAIVAVQTALGSSFGQAGALVMAAAIMISTFGCNNGLILAGARVYYAMARDRLFFARAAAVNAHHVPSAALVAQGIWAALLTLPRTIERIDPQTKTAIYGNVYTQLLEYIVSADLVFYALMVGAVIVMRRRAPQAPRPYRTFGYPFVPLIYLALSSLLIFDLAYLAPATSGIGYLFVLAGVPVYYLFRRKRS